MLRAAWRPHRHPVVQQRGDEDGGEAEGDEAVLHGLHHGGEHHQVGVEGGEDGPVDVAALGGVRREVT